MSTRQIWWIGGLILVIAFFVVLAPDAPEKDEVCDGSFLEQRRERFDDLEDEMYDVSEGRPFFTSLGGDFDDRLNEMWRIYGAVEDGSIVNRHGNEPAYFEWMGLKLMWSDEIFYKQEFFERVRDFPIEENGYVWSWHDTRYWPTGDGSLHQETAAKYIMGLYRYFIWTRDEEVLFEEDRKRVGAGDVSRGMTLIDKARSAMGYQLQELNGKEGLLVIDNEHNTGLYDGHPTNYWDNFPLGHKDGYCNIYFYASLLAMAEIEEILGNTEDAEYYRELSEKVKKRYNETFWSEENERYIGCIDVEGNIRDLGFTFLNTEALAYTLGNEEKAKSIYEWLDGERIIKDDCSIGDDIYKFRFAPRSVTRAVESMGEPYWWYDLNGAITVGPDGNAQFGEHMQNGGAIFYTSFYDLIARARYLGPDNAFERFSVIMEEFRKDRLKRRPPNNVGADWKMGIIGEFPESGLVAAAFLYAFLGIDADLRGLNIIPNLPDDMEYAGVRGLRFGRGKYTIRVQREEVIVEVQVAPENGLFGVVGGFEPHSEFRLTVLDNHGNKETEETNTVDKNGEATYELSVKKGHVIRITSV